MTFASGATWIDVLVVVGYLALIMWIGIRFSRRQTSIKEYFLAGRNMGWLPVGLSLMGAIHSGLHYLQAPSATIRYGTIFLIGMTSWLVIYPWAMWVILPFYRKRGTFTCYEYLETRFGAGARGLAAVIFLLWRLGWVATALYVPALAVHAVSGGRVKLLPLVIILGAVITTSTMLGGMRAVIWADVMQFVIMVGGLGTTLFLVIGSVPGGVESIISHAHAAGKLALYQSIPAASQGSFAAELKWILIDKTSVVGILVATVVGRLAIYSADQVMIQRFQTTRTLKDARRALLVHAISDVIWQMILAFVGIALFTYFAIVKPLPDVVRQQSDFIFPYFICEVFPTGAIGIVVATIIAASLAAIGSALNSCTSVAIIDLYRFKYKRSELSSLTASRWLTLAFGAVGTVIATQLSQLGDLIEISNRMIQTFTGPLIGLYLLGMFTRRSNQAGAMFGGILGTLGSIYLALIVKMGFIWPTVYGLLATVIGGYLVSVLTPSRTSGVAEMTWRRVMARPSTPELEATASSFQ